jgi:hypothetical protein
MWEPATLELQYSHQQISTTHLAGSFLLQSQTKAVLVKYTVGPIQIKGTGTRQLSVRLRFGPLEGCLHGFPISLLVSPSGPLWSLPSGALSSA